MTDIEIKMNNRGLVYLPELLFAVQNEKTKKRKIELLQKYWKRDKVCKELLLHMIQTLYHPKVIIDLPDEIPPYKSEYNDYSFAPMTLHKAYTKVPHFVKGQHSYVENNSKREMVFIKFLESLHKPDAEIYASMLTKKLPEKYKSVTRKLLEEALPDAFVGINDSETAVKK